MNKVLIAGATGYLGAYVLKEITDRKYFTKAIVRDIKKFDQKNLKANEVVIADVTNKLDLAGCCKGIDIVFSSIGITKQKEGFTYMDIDYTANLNLLEEALKSGVKKFIYISVFDGDKMRDLKICQAKEKFADVLKSSGMEYCIIRPTGYFSDMAEFYKMAEKGAIYLFGNGTYRMNPIDGADLAKVCVDSIPTDHKEISVGGPDILMHKEIATIAFNVSGKKEKIVCMPNWVRKLTLFFLRTFTSSKFYGPIEFFMTVLARDIVAPTYGDHSLKSYFLSLKK